MNRNVNGKGKSEMRMRKRGLVAVVAVFGALALGAAEPYLNVRDFGAKGDGVADDTAAIRAALARAAKENVARRVRVGHRCVDGGGVGDGPLREVFFPEGVYRVSEPLLVRRDAVLRGERATIRMAARDRDILFFNSAFRCFVVGLAFEGGATALRFSTHNNDTAHVTIRGCRFAGTSAAAVECLSFSFKTNGQTRALVPYLVQKDDTLLPNPRYVGVRGGYPNSTLLTFEDCAFEDCARVADFACDGAVMRRVRVVTAKGAPGGAICVGNRLHAYDLDVTVRRAANARQSVFETKRAGAMLDIERSVFRTDDGTGVCTVRSSTVPGYAASAISLNDVTVESGAADDDAPVVIEPKTCPNRLRVVGLVERGVRHASPIHYVGGRNEADLAALRYFKGYPLAESFQVQVLEKPLKRLARPAAPTRAAGATLYATDFGLDDDLSTDDTAAVRRLFAAARGQAGATLVFPATWVDLSETLDVPDGVAIVARGTCGFRMADETKDIFRVGGFSDVRFANLHFKGGRRQVALSCAPRGFFSRLVGRKPFASFTDCFFSDAADYAVEAVSGDGAADGRNDFDLVMEGGIAFTCKIYRGNGTAWDDRRWSEILPEAKGTRTGAVAYDNRGVLVLHDMLSVPMFFADMIPMSKVPIFEEATAGDFRWVDNRGDFISLFTRYGGEWGGATPVYNYGNGRVYMEGGYAWFETRLAQRHPVLADSPDARLRLTHVTFSPNLGGQRVEFAWRDAQGNVRPTARQDITFGFPLH